MVLKLVESRRKDITIVGINDLAPYYQRALLNMILSRKTSASVTLDTKENTLTIDGTTIRVFSEPNPAKLPWKALDVDMVFECSGVFADKEKAQAHLEGGAKKVLISAPAKNVDRTVVYGVNHTSLTPQDSVVSNASCTTNCLAPLVKTLDDLVGVEKGYMTTIHSYTGDQRLIDTAHADLRRARAGLDDPHIHRRCPGCGIGAPSHGRKIGWCCHSRSNTQCLYDRP